jgi:hypothetical protein
VKFPARAIEKLRERSHVMKKHVGGRQDASGTERGGGPDSAKGAGDNFESAGPEKGGGHDSAKGSDETKGTGKKGGKKSSTGPEVTR